MGYPVRYRSAGPQRAPAAAPRPRPAGNVVRFPRPKWQGAGRFGPPRSLPGRPNFGLRPRFIPRPAPPRVPLAGAVGRGLLIGVALDLLWWGANSDFDQPLKAAPVLGSGWQRVCGPFPYPGPPYLYQRHWRFTGPEAPTCLAPLGNQAIGVDLDGAPTVNSSGLFIYYGPNSIPRYYLYEQWTYPGGNGNAALRNPAYRVNAASDAANARPTDAVPVTQPKPMWATPLYPPAPYPEQASRAYGIYPPERPITPTVVVAMPHPTLSPGVRAVLVSQPTVRDRPPGPREKERKLEYKSKAGLALVSAFRAIQAFGQANAFADAMWRALPRQYRTARARWWQKYIDVYAHLEHVDPLQAAYNAAGWAINRAAYGYFFDRVTRQLQHVAGVNTGWRIYRGLQQSGDLLNTDLAALRRQLWWKSKSQRKKTRRFK